MKHQYTTLLKNILYMFDFNIGIILEINLFLLLSNHPDGVQSQLIQMVGVQLYNISTLRNGKVSKEALTL